MRSRHNWKFFRAGGFDQVRLDSGEDLLRLDGLDQKLWVALACPASGLEFDSKTLALIDADNDGRIRVPEVLAAVQWAAACLKDPKVLLERSPVLPLHAINDATPQGQQVLRSAHQILEFLKKPDAREISLQDTADTARIFAHTRFNGDGVVTANSTEDPFVAGVITDIITCLGPTPDRSGQPGVNQAQVNAFFSAAQAFSDWWAKGEANAAIRPLDGATEPAAALVRRLHPKMEDFFLRCRLAAFDPRSTPVWNPEHQTLFGTAAKDLSRSSAEIAALPLAQVGPGKPLPLQEGVNPAWAEDLARLESLVVRPFLNGKGFLTEGDWSAVAGKFAPYENWVAAKSGAVVEPLGLERVRAILASPAQKAIGELLAQDQALEAEAQGIGLVDKLVRFHAHLATLLNNFVSFRDFYEPSGQAIFQAGTLYLDQRSCQLCLAVSDAGKHAALAGLAGAYLAYCDCVRAATGQKRQIVAAFTGGDADYLMVGRNGIFYDRQGQDWDATIVKVVENPISIRQAFWAPYKKLVRMIEERVAKRAAAADAAGSEKLTTVADRVTSADKAPPSQAGARKIDVGVVAALGVAVGAIGGALAALATGLMTLAIWKIPLVFLGIILLISLPSMVIAWLKLRKRNLGPLLDANGWAINSRAFINVPFGGSLTRVASLPPGSVRDLVDPFAEKKQPWGLYLTAIGIILLALSWYWGKLDRGLPGTVRSTSVLGTNAPAYQPPSAVTVTNVPLIQ